MCGALPLSFLIAFGGFAGVVVVDVGDGDDLDVGLLEERVEELIPPAARADQAEPDLLVGRRGRATPGSAEKGTRAGRAFPLFPRNSRRVIRSVAMAGSPFWRSMLG